MKVLEERKKWFVKKFSKNFRTNPW